MVDVLEQKILDLDIPRFQVEFDPDEADECGAFVEDAIEFDAAIEATAELFEDEQGEE